MLENRRKIKFAPMPTPFLRKYGLHLLAGFTILPFLFLSAFLHPVGIHGWDWATRHSGLGLSEYTFWEEQVYWYSSIVGRYASTAILSLTPYWFSITSFKFFPILMITSLLISLHFLLKSIFMNTSFKRVGLVISAIAIIYVHQLSSPYEAFYNLSCVLTYQTGAFFFFLMVGVTVRSLLQQKTLLRSFLIGMLLFMTIGTNEISLIASCGFWFILFFGKYYYHRKWDRWVLSFFTLALLFSFFEILAPGNFNRMEYSPNANRLGLTLFLTLSVSLFNWVRWLSSTALIIFMILYIPIGVQIVKKSKSLKTFNYQWATFLGIITFQPVCLFLLFWSVGDEALPERVMDLIFLTLLPFIFYFLQSMISWALEQNYLSSNFTLNSFIRYPLYLFIFFNLFFNNLRINKSEEARQTTNYLSIIQTDSNASTAYLELLTGNAYQYDKTQYQMYEIVKNSKRDTCVVPYPSVLPKIIYDQTFDRKAREGEEYLGHYFNNKKVKLVRYISELDVNQ